MADITSITVTITAGDKISNYERTRGQRLGLILPALVSGAIYIRGAANKAGAGSGRIQKEDGSGDFATPATTGVICLTIPMHFPYPFIAVESASTQTTTNRVITVVGKD